MKKHTASIAAAALMLAVATAGVGSSAGTADAFTLPPGATAGSSTISAMLGANAPQGTVVKQGDRIRVQRLLWDFNCTLGYVDPHAGVGYTAGHCGLPGEPVLNANYQIIGHFEASKGLSMNLNIPLAYAADVVPSLMPQVSRGMLADVARIRFNPGVVARGLRLGGQGQRRHHIRLPARFDPGRLGRSRVDPGEGVRRREQRRVQQHRRHRGVPGGVRAPAGAVGTEPQPHTQPSVLPAHRIKLGQ